MLRGSLAKEPSRTSRTSLEARISDRKWSERQLPCPIYKTKTNSNWITLYACTTTRYATMWVQYVRISAIFDYYLEVSTSCPTSCAPFYHMQKKKIGWFCPQVSWDILSCVQGQSLGLRAAHDSISSGSDQTISPKAPSWGISWVCFFQATGFFLPPLRCGCLLLEKSGKKTSSKEPFRNDISGMSHPKPLSFKISNFEQNQWSMANPFCWQFSHSRPGLGWSFESDLRPSP